MKYLVIHLFILIPIFLTAQKKLEFVGKKINVPEKCELVSKYEIECGNFTLSWLYMDKSNIENVLFDMISKMQQTPDFKYRPIRVLIDSVPSSGFVASFTSSHIKYFQLYAAGTVRGQAVLIQGMDLIPFWRHEHYNKVFDELLAILPDGDRPVLEMKMDESSGILDDKPVPEKEGE
ncbi:MAG: hypothetical protein IPN87_05565 [Saprospiraceae bacterium]|nr:hypothetical protein [Candidatus Brachybacter algidus]